MRIKAAVLVASDRVSAGLSDDRSGPAAMAALAPVADVVETAVVPDECDSIRDRLIGWCEAGVDVIFTLGGTGLGPRDVTPEATRSVIEREAPALTVALMMNGLADTPRAMLSRAVAGQRGHTLIINLPGSPSAVTSSIEYVRDILPHAVEMARGGDHETPDGAAQAHARVDRTPPLA